MWMAGSFYPSSPSAAAGYALGYGGDILVGYRFDRHLSLSADLGYYDCDQKISGASAAGEWALRAGHGSGTLQLWRRPL